MRDVDRRACAKPGLSPSILMENAGKAVAGETASFLKEKLGKDPASSRVIVLCGRGANGGDGLVAARYLKESGADVEAVLCPPKRQADGKETYPELVMEKLQKAKAAGVVARDFDAGALDLSGADALLDALLGTGSSGKPAGPVRDMIQAVTRSKKPVLAVDIPSGLNPDTGHHTGVYITAAATYTLGFPKRGLLAVHARKYVGELKILDIGYPRNLAAKAGFEKS